MMSTEPSAGTAKNSLFLPVGKANEHDLFSPSICGLRGDEIRALRRLQREQPPGPHVFATERGGPMAPKSFHTLIARLGERAKDGVSNPPAHAATWLRLRPGKCRPRHASAAGVAGASQYSAHGALHGNGAEPISRFLAELKTHFGMSAYRSEPDFAVAAR